jgi:hypothetical protein
MPSFPGFKLPGDHQLLHQHPDLLHLRKQVQDHLPAGVNVIKLFFFITDEEAPSSLTMRPNKIEGLTLETLSSQVLEFEGKARANPIGAPFRCFLLG